MCGVTSGVFDAKSSNHVVEVFSGDPGSGSSVNGEFGSGVGAAPFVDL
jgi:hypothetical protein